MNGRIYPPIAESTWSGTPYFLQILAIYGTSSTFPCGYWGAEHTTTTVLVLIAFLKCFKDILLF